MHRPDWVPTISLAPFGGPVGETVGETVGEAVGVGGGEVVAVLEGVGAGGNSGHVLR
jgi:hypothetical protein